MTIDDLRQAIFGSFDGLTSALGVIAGLLAAGVHDGGRILAGALGLAVAATIGMGAGEYLSDPAHDPRRALLPRWTNHRVRCRPGRQTSRTFHHPI